MVEYCKKGYTLTNLQWIDMADAPNRRGAGNTQCQRQSKKKYYSAKESRNDHHLKRYGAANKTKLGGKETQVESEVYHGNIDVKAALAS
jgi:hypothetical protein